MNPDFEAVTQSLSRKLLAAEVNHSVAEGVIRTQARRIQELEDALADDDEQPDTPRSAS